MRLSDGRRSYAASCAIREYELHSQYVRFTLQTVNYRPGMIESGKKSRLSSAIKFIVHLQPGLLKLGVQNRRIATRNLRVLSLPHSCVAVSQFFAKVTKSFGPKL